MWINKGLFEKLTSVYDNFFSTYRKDTDLFLEIRAKETEVALERIIAAKNAEINVITYAKDEQIKSLREDIAHLNEQIKHERSRAEAAIDRLLLKEEIRPVGSADLERRQAEKEASLPASADPRLKALKDVFGQLGSVGDDDSSEESPTEKLVTIGGVPV